MLFDGLSLLLRIPRLYCESELQQCSSGSKWILHLPLQFVVRKCLWIFEGRNEGVLLREATIGKHILSTLYIYY